MLRAQSLGLVTTTTAHQVGVEAAAVHSATVCTAWQQSGEAVQMLLQGSQGQFLCRLVLAPLAVSAGLVGTAASVPLSSNSVFLVPMFMFMFAAGQRERMLAATERMQKTSDRLQVGKQQLAETEVSWAWDWTAAQP